MKKEQKGDSTYFYDMMPTKRWICPHCKKINTLNDEQISILSHYFKVIDQCQRCGYLHYFEIRLSDEFKQNLINELFKIIDEKSKKE